MKRAKQSPLDQSDYQTRLDADRVTAAWRNHADRQPKDLTWAPLFQGEAVAPEQDQVERQSSLFDEKEPQTHVLEQQK